MIQVREYARITYDQSVKSSLDIAVVSRPTFEWLLDLHRIWQGHTSKMVLSAPNTLRLGSYVGFLQSPTGETIEILPKIKSTELTDVELVKTRSLLRKMLLSALKIKPREGGDADLSRMDSPLHEWIFESFLEELSFLIRRGLRFDYNRIEEENLFLKGQLDSNRQNRQLPHQANRFHIRHDIYSPESIENKLIKTALEYTLKSTKVNWALANELNHFLSEITSSRQPILDLPKWRDDKLMQSYRAIRPWCNLILEGLNPNFQKGSHRGISLLFPMEYLFENYVAQMLKQQLPRDCKLTTQASRKFLSQHQLPHSQQLQNWFMLKPDLLIETRKTTVVLDTKWKLLDSSASTSDQKYGLNQSDFYQLYAYGQKYQQGKGDMILIYPKTNRFSDPLPVFHFDDMLNLWVVPFDLEKESFPDQTWSTLFTPLNELDE